MIKRLAALLVFLNCAAVYGQTIKTDILVIGCTPAGIAAAIQSARSKLKTVIIEPGAQLCSGLTGKNQVTIETDKNLPSGIWGEFRKRVHEHYKTTPGYDTTFNTPLQFEPNIGASILSGIADTVKKLTIKLNTQFTGLKKDGEEWEVTITQNGKNELVKTKVIIDATATAMVAAKAGATIPVLNEAETAASKLYRTSVALSGKTYGVPVKAFVAQGTDNLLVTAKLYPDNDIQNLPDQLLAGQGAGVIAAYCAFFKTTTANLNVRVIQGELLDFKAYILPLEDIGTDPYWRAIQQVCATGLLKGMQSNNGQLLFVPDSTVNIADVKPVLLEIYTRAFLWFNKEKPGVKFTVGNTLSFISELTLTDPDNLRKSISVAWKTKYKFTSDFNMSRPITRREFAILANKFLNPFARTVDLNGRVVN